MTPEEANLLKRDVAAAKRCIADLESRKQTSGVLHALQLERQFVMQSRTKLIECGYCLGDT